MAIEIKSPTFPESVAEGTIASWVKKEGEFIKQDEVIVEIETEKVVLEVVAPFDGVISEIIKPAGDIVKSAELIARFKEEALSKKHISKTSDLKIDSLSSKLKNVDHPRLLVLTGILLSEELDKILKQNSKIDNPYGKNYKTQLHEFREKNTTKINLIKEKIDDLINRIQSVNK